MNADLRKKAKNYGKFQKTQKYKTCYNRKKENLFSIRIKFSYYKVFHRKFISNRKYKTEILMDKPVYLGFSVPELSTIFSYEFWCDYVKPK